MVRQTDLGDYIVFLKMNIKVIIKLRFWNYGTTVYVFILTYSFSVPLLPVQGLWRPGAYPEELRVLDWVRPGQGANLPQDTQAHTLTK